MQQHVRCIIKMFVFKCPLNLQSLKIQCYLFYSFSQKKYFCTKKVSNSQCNISMLKGSKGKTRLKPRLYLSLTPSSVWICILSSSLNLLAPQILYCLVQQSSELCVLYSVHGLALAECTKLLLINPYLVFLRSIWFIFIKLFVHLIQKKKFTKIQTCRIGRKRIKSDNLSSGAGSTSVLYYIFQREKGLKEYESLVTILSHGSTELNGQIGSNTSIRYLSIYLSISPVYVV